MEKLQGNTLDINYENIIKLKGIFPDVFIDNKIDFDKLKAVLGEKVEENEKAEDPQEKTEEAA